MRVPRNYRFWRRTGRNANVPPPAPQRKGRSWSARVEQRNRNGASRCQSFATDRSSTAGSGTRAGCPDFPQRSLSRSLAFLCAEYSCGGSGHVTIASSPRDRRGRLQLQSKRANIRDKNEEQLRTN
jgi:hypothetical protein